MRDYFEWAYSTYHISTRAQRVPSGGTKSADRRARRRQESSASDPAANGKRRQ